MRVRLAVALGVIGTVGVIAFCVAFWRSVDLNSSSTAGIAYFFIPLYGLAGLALVWGLVGFLIDRGKKKQKKRFANPS
jgi:hypothetical protein